VNKQLKEYADELGVEGLGIELLISSHRNLKAELKEYRDRKQKDWDAAREAMNKYFSENPSEYISINELMEITLAEFVERFKNE